jgi:hypothetical protein
VAEIIVDGVLGTGLRGPARGPAAGAIRYIRSQANESLVVSIDVPSGLNADTGGTEGDAVMADLTVTMGLPKVGLLEPQAIDFVGSGGGGRHRPAARGGGRGRGGSERELVFHHGSQGAVPAPQTKFAQGQLRPRAGGGGSARLCRSAAALAARAATRLGRGPRQRGRAAGIREVVAGAVLEAMVHVCPPENRRRVR